MGNPVVKIVTNKTDMKQSQYSINPDKRVAILPATIAKCALQFFADPLPPLPNYLCLSKTKRG